MQQAALGFRAHSGWTTLVATAIQEGSPHVLVRERPQLVKTFTYEFRQPYHTAKRKPAADAADFVARMRAEARALAHQAISSVQGALQRQSYELRYCSLLLSSSKPLPGLPQILASHALIHTADGELFRNSLLHAGESCGLETFTVRESELFDRASHGLQLPREELVRRVIQLGTRLGPPWTQDEKLATLAAWLSLARVDDQSRTLAK
jgi:hypothetical protein